MSGFQGKLTFVVSAILYIVFNLRLGGDVLTSTKATLWQIGTTAPYVAGLSYIIIALLQYMADGAKVPWDRRLRIFLQSASSPASSMAYTNTEELEPEDNNTLALRLCKWLSVIPAALAPGTCSTG